MSCGVEMTSGLSIKEVAEQTGLAAGTIRMWEQRYGFPDPARTDSGYRVYAEDDVEALRRVLAYRHRGLSVPAAIERAQETGGADHHPSIYAAVSASDGASRPQVLKKSTLVALSRAIEHEALAQAVAPVLFGAFQHEGFYREVEARYRRISRFAHSSVVFADFPRIGRPAGGPVEVPIAPEDVLGNEWAVIVDAPGYAACLLAWELPGTTVPGGEGDANRRFESIWTLDPRATRKASIVASRLAGRADPELGEHLEGLLADRPLGRETPSPTLTSLTNRMVSYMEASAR